MSVLLLAGLLATSAVADCASAAACNRDGTAAYQAGDFAAAAERFDRQIDFAETDLDAASETAAEPEEALHAARDLALNNAALARIKAGECLKARAYLELARPGTKATLANRRLLETRCGERLANAAGPLGEYWQYAGHGQWNRLSLRETGDETLRLDAFWMRIARGPIDTYGVAAFGELEQVYLHPRGGGAAGRFDGYEPEPACELEVRFEPQALEVSITPEANCRTGGAGAELHGRYLLVATELPDSED